MTQYPPGDLVLVSFPFVGGQQSKNRPALVVLDTGDADVIVARVTTQIHGTPYDIVIAEWARAGLLAASVVRLHKLATIEKALIRRRLGALQTADERRVRSVIRTMYGGW